MNGLANAAERSKRTRDSITLVAVTKGRAVAEIQTALAAGATDIGENRVQEAQQKYTPVNAFVDATGADVNRNACRWHLIGHLQRNKVKTAVEMFSLIHSVDSLRLLAEIARRSEQRSQRTDVLIQVNTTREASKYGVAAEDVLSVHGRRTGISGSAHCWVDDHGTVNTFTGRKPSRVRLAKIAC